MGDEAILASDDLRLATHPQRCALITRLVDGVLESVGAHIKANFQDSLEVWK